MKILVINGYPRSGKDTFAEYLGKAWGASCEAQCRIISTVDIPKDIARTWFNWDGEKTPKMREFLSEMKKLLDTYFDLTEFMIETTRRSIDEVAKDGDGEPLIILHCREPEKIKEIQKKYNNVTTLFVIRDKAKQDALKQQTNSADLNVEKFKYDIYVDNNGTFYELGEKAWDVVKILKAKN